MARSVAFQSSLNSCGTALTMMSGGCEMKVTVYFEAKAGAHMVAQFDEEATYMVCLPALEELAKSQGYIVTESVDHAWTADKFEPTVD